MAKEPNVNHIALNIDRAEREFAQRLADIAGISVEDGNRVSVFYRMKYLAGLNDRATSIDARSPDILKPAAIKAALLELNKRD